jgi:hypothetical protein
VDEILPGTVSVIVVNFDVGAIDGKLFEIRSAVAVELSVKVGVDATLEEGILAEVDSSNDVTRLELRPH